MLLTYKVVLCYNESDVSLIVEILKILLTRFCPYPIIIIKMGYVHFKVTQG